MYDQFVIYLKINFLALKKPVVIIPQLKKNVLKREHALGVAP